MKVPPAKGMMHPQSGSVMIMVLWLIVVAGYLSGEYILHNRVKTGTAIHSEREFVRMNVMDSVVAFVSSVGMQIPGYTYKSGTWLALEMDGVDFFVRMENEKGKMNINKGPDAGIRDAVRKLFEDSGYDQADLVADSILDWRDTDDLTRLNGVEKEYYHQLENPVNPANGYFKTLTEILQVRGMTHDMFWGGLLDNLYQEEEEEEERGEFAEKPEKSSLVERLTLFSPNVHRLYVVFPENEKKRASCHVIFLSGKAGKKLNVMEKYSTNLEITKEEA